MELKECPFCGGPSTIAVRWVLGERRTWKEHVPPNARNVRYTEKGGKCGRGVYIFDGEYHKPQCLDPGCLGHHISKNFRTPEEAAEWWNRRADNG